MYYCSAMLCGLTRSLISYQKRDIFLWRLATRFVINNFWRTYMFRWASSEWLENWGVLWNKSPALSSNWQKNFRTNFEFETGRSLQKLVRFVMAATTEIPTPSPSVFTMAPSHVFVAAATNKEASSNFANSLVRNIMEKSMYRVLSEQKRKYMTSLIQANCFH